MTSPAALVEFPADDTDRATRFWTGLLNVTLDSRTESEGEGWQTHTGGTDLGVHPRGRGPGDTNSLPYFTVPDLPAALRPGPRAGRQGDPPRRPMGGVPGLGGQPVRADHTAAVVRAINTDSQIALLDSRSQPFPAYDRDPLRSHKLTPIDVYDLAAADLSPFVGLIIGGGADQEFLFENKEVIQEFLSAGRTLVFSGHLFREWLPGCGLFVPKVIDSVRDYAVDLVEEHPIFNGVEPGGPHLPSRGRRVLRSRPPSAARRRPDPCPPGQQRANRVCRPLNN